MFMNEDFNPWCEYLGGGRFKFQDLNKIIIRWIHYETTARFEGVRIGYHKNEPNYRTVGDFGLRVCNDFGITINDIMEFMNDPKNVNFVDKQARDYILKKYE